MTPDGTLTVLHNFSGGSDGAFPIGGLVQALTGTCTAPMRAAARMAGACSSAQPWPET